MIAAATLQGQENDLIVAAERMYSSLMKAAGDLFTENPVNWATSHGIWNRLSSIINALLPVACSIVALLFLIGFLANSVDVKEELTFDRALRMLIRLGITEWFVLNSVTISGYIFQFVRGLTGLLNNATDNLSFSQAVGTHIGEMAQMSRVVFLFPTILYLIVMPLCGCLVFVQAFTRMMRLLLILPYGPFAYATMASGLSSINHSLSAYLKYILGLGLEAFSCLLAIEIGRGLLTNRTLFDLTTLVTTDHLVPATLALFQGMLSALILTWLVKQSQDLASKALGLMG